MYMYQDVVFSGSSSFYTFIGFNRGSFEKMGGKKGFQQDSLVWIHNFCWKINGKHHFRPLQAMYMYQDVVFSGSSSFYTFIGFNRGSFEKMGGKKGSQQDSLVWIHNFCWKINGKHHFRPLQAMYMYQDVVFSGSSSFYTFIGFNRGSFENMGGKEGSQQDSLVWRHLSFSKAMGQLCHFNVDLKVVNTQRC